MTGIGRRRSYRRRPPFTVAGHRLTYSVARDPEGNFWTVECSCGQFQEGTGSRKEARNEGYWHKDQARKQAEATPDEHHVATYWSESLGRYVTIPED